MGHEIDGRLASWEDVANLESWQDLLLGNGLSSHIWPAFKYRSLYDRACGAEILKVSDRRLFDAFSTENFESILSALAVTIQTLESINQRSPKALTTRYLRVQKALGSAIREVHVELSDLPPSTREAVGLTLSDYQYVFTTSYDLILYWCAGHEDSFEGFADYFFCNGRLEFDPRRTEVGSNSTCLVYLHGALHLMVNATGVTRKLRRGHETLLDQFGKPDRDDPLARPLLIAEGSAHEKARIIRENEYLSFGLKRLRQRKHGLVVFGLGLRDEDAHLVEALNFRSKRPIAVGLRPKTQSENRRRQARVRHLLDVDELYFFDSTSHPLGAPAIAGRDECE